MKLYTRHVNIITDKGIHRDWSLKVLVGWRTFTRQCQFNKGAGYIGGATLYVCWNCVDRKSMYRPRKRLQFGITRNANKVPWTRH